MQLGRGSRGFANEVGSCVTMGPCLGFFSPKWEMTHTLWRGYLQEGEEVSYRGFSLVMTRSEMVNFHIC